MTKVVANKNMPARLPIWQSITIWLALDHWHAPQWLYGALGLLLLVMWIAEIYKLFTQKETEVL